MYSTTDMFLVISITSSIITTTAYPSQRITSFLLRLWNRCQEKMLISGCKAWSLTSLGIARFQEGLLLGTAFYENAHFIPHYGQKRDSGSLETFFQILPEVRNIGRSELTAGYYRKSITKETRRRVNHLCNNHVGY